MTVGGEQLEEQVAPHTGAQRQFCIVIAPHAGAVTTHTQLDTTDLKACREVRLFFVAGRLTAATAHRLGQALLADPVTEKATIIDLETPPNGVSSASGGTAAPHSAHTVDVTLLPGVTDPAAENLVRAAALLGLEGVDRAATGRRYLLEGDLTAAAATRLATAVLANPVIHRVRVNAPLIPPFAPPEPPDATVESVPLRDADRDRLAAISAERRLALDAAEMTAVRDHFRREEREPTDAELEMVAQTWSEHCVHKTFRARIDYTGPDGDRQKIDGLLNTYIRAATETVNRPWVHSAFVDNAGIIAFDGRYDLAFKVETHNHPSALEPFGGANTGIGGVVRDILGVSARPIANTDILCFGPPDLPADALPEGVLHPQRIADGVVHGIEDYGNKMGIPTVNGAVYYDPGYTSNPLVYCGCLGILPRGSHPTRITPGDHIVALGGATGRDGLRGATFSSMGMDADTGAVAGSAVQIGHPIQEKQVQEVLLRARDEHLYSAVTDCGAGGFSSAVGEMAEGLGARVYLERAPLKYAGLRPWEIWLSEAQERMVLAVPPAHWPRLQQLAAAQDVTATRLGTFTDDGRLHVTWHGQSVVDLPLSLLHDGRPARTMTAVWQPESPPLPLNLDPLTPQQALLRLLAHPNIRSKEAIIRRYDHEVQGGTAVKPLTGVANHGPADAAVLVPLETHFDGDMPQTGDPDDPTPAVALANGIAPQFGRYDPYAMAWTAVDEAIRNLVATGADPDRIALLDNFCWGDPTRPEQLGALVRCAQGCHDAAVAHNAPFISGKDSLYNEYTGADGRRHAIPGTLLISAIGHVPDVARTVTSDFKQPGNFIFLVGDTRAELGGSHYAAVGGPIDTAQNRPPRPVRDAAARYHAVHAAIGAGFVRAAHDCSEGGVAVALAEMCLGGGVGAEIELRHVPAKPYLFASSLLFGESGGRLLLEIPPAHEMAVRTLLAGVPHACIGIIGGENLRINALDAAAPPLVDLAVAELNAAWRPDLPPAAGRDARDGMAGRRMRRRYDVPALKSASRVLILHANGTNRDRDAALAVHLAGGTPEIVHVNQLLAGERRLADYAMLVIPGGFSYGDDLGAGRLWAATLEHALGDDLRRFVADGRPTLGICNGFQVLVKAGLLPDPTAGQRDVTLTYNAGGRFECRWVTLEPHPNSRSLFTAGLEAPIYCPVAHGEGRLAVRNPAVADRLAADGLVALTYATPNGGSPGYPANPNGSIGAIAALTNAAGNVLGLMPHPEDHIFPWQHPRHHRGEWGNDGLRLFAKALKNC